MKDGQDRHQASVSAQPEATTRCKVLQTGLIFLGKFVGGFLFAVGILLLLLFFLNTSDREPMERLPTFIFAICLIVPGFCLWIRAGQATFGFWRGVCTLMGAFLITGGVLNFLLSLAAHVTGMNKSAEQALPEGMVLGIGIFGLVLGIPLLIFGFRSKKGSISSK